MAAAAIRTVAGEPSGPPKWTMLDRYVFTRYDIPPASEEEEDGRTASSPECRTSHGVPFRISLRLSAPPATSRFYLHMPARAADHHCRILGSHRDALLFSMYMPLSQGDERRPRLFKQDLFVYIAGGSTPTLTLLPPCTESESESESLEEEYDDGDYDGISFVSDDDYDDDDSSVESDDAHPLAGIIQFSDLEAVGVLRNDTTGEYCVAYLCVSRCITPGSGADMVEAQMCLYYSCQSKWVLHGLPIIYRDDDALCELLRWSTSRVVTFGTTHFCWIDYNCGILLCQVFTEHPDHRPRVTYVSLPVEAHLFSEACMDMYRSISAVEEDDEAGSSNYKLMFVDVTPWHGYYFRPPPSNGFEMNIWSLIVVKTGGMMEWKHEFVFGHDELRISDLVPSPHGPLMFPVISMEEPHVAYFAVGEHGYGVKKVWLVRVDLIGRSAEYAFPYLKGEEDLLGDDADMARKKVYCFEPFLPCDVNLF